jgi:hypothetical protein
MTTRVARYLLVALFFTWPCPAHAKTYNFSGEWEAPFTTFSGLKIETVAIRQTGRDFWGTKVTGDEIVPAGTMNLRGTYSANLFFAEQLCGPIGYRTWRQTKVTIIDNNHFKAEGGCSGNVIWKRKPLTVALLRNSS